MVLWRKDINILDINLDLMRPSPITSSAGDIWLWFSAWDFCGAVLADYFEEGCALVSQLKSTYYRG